MASRHNCRIWREPVPRLREGQLTANREYRVKTQVAPLMVRGLSSRQIARELGINQSTALRDMQMCRKHWNETYANSRDEWSGRVLATHEWLLTELAEAWMHSKQCRITRIVNADGTQMMREEPPDPRWLSGMLAVTKEVSTFLGIREGADSISRIEVPEATRQALAPMTADAYMDLLSASEGLSSINAVPPIQRRGMESVDVTTLRLV